VPLQYRFEDGFDEEAARVAWDELTGLWDRYVEDCIRADTLPTIIDFMVWSIQIRAFTDGVSIGSDQEGEL
jgi:hypothetical protein